MKINNYIIYYFYDSYQGDWSKMNEAIESKEAIKPDFEFNEKYKNTIVFLDKLIQDKVRNESFVPYLFFYKGNKELLNKKTLLVNNHFNFSILDSINFDEYVLVVNLEELNHQFVEKLKSFKTIYIIKDLNKIKSTNDNLYISWRNPNDEVDRFYVVEEADKANKLAYSLADFKIKDCLIEQSYILENYNINVNDISINEISIVKDIDLNNDENRDVLEKSKSSISESKGNFLDKIIFYIKSLFKKG